MKPHRRGYTLMEVLVVLVITGLVSTVLMQALLQVLGLQQRFGFQLLRSETGAMQADWYRQVVQSQQPELPDSPNRLRGQERELRGQASDPFASAQGSVRPLELALRRDERSARTQLQMRSEGREVTLAEWPDLTHAAFVYVDAKGDAHPQWPPPMGTWPSLPAAVQLRLRSAGHEELLVAVPRSSLRPRMAANIFEAPR